MKTTVMQSVCIAILVSSHIFAQDGPMEKYFQVSFELANQTTLNEPVVLNVTIQNRSNEPISFDLGLQRKSAYHFMVRTPDNGLMEMPVIRKGGAGPICLEAQEKYAQRLILNEWFPFDLPGRYLIGLILEMPYKIGETQLPFIGDDGDGRQIEETFFEVLILPRNPIVLRQKCEDLVKRLRQTENALGRMDLANELSHIKDSIAIPYLTMLLEEKQELASIEGLMRIGSDEAMEAMILATKSEYDAAKYAKELLRQKLPEIRDLRIKEKVRVAINDRIWE
jgi:hypothetical protein